MDRRPMLGALVELIEDDNERFKVRNCAFGGKFTRFDKSSIVFVRNRIICILVCKINVWNNFSPAKPKRSGGNATQRAFPYGAFPLADQGGFLVENEFHHNFGKRSAHLHKLNTSPGGEGAALGIRAGPARTLPPIFISLFRPVQKVRWR